MAMPGVSLLEEALADAPACSPTGAAHPAGATSFAAPTTADGGPSGPSGWAEAGSQSMAVCQNLPPQHKPALST